MASFLDRSARCPTKACLESRRFQAATSDVQKIIGLIRESQELTIRDVLPYLSDSMTIDAFKAEICECLDTYEGRLLVCRRAGTFCIYGCKDKSSHCDRCGCKQSSSMLPARYNLKQLPSRTFVAYARQEMDDHRRALQAFKEDLKMAEEFGA